MLRNIKKQVYGSNIQLKNGIIGNFGGFFLTFDAFDSFGLSKMIDKQLGIRGIQALYSYSDIVKNLAAIYLSGGDAIEDVNIFRDDAYTANPRYRFCSADTILRCFSELQQDNTRVQSVTGNFYLFNLNEKLNKLLLKSLLRCNLICSDKEVVFDYDNQLIATEKRDVKYSYKKMNGYYWSLNLIFNIY